MHEELRINPAIPKQECCATESISSVPECKRTEFPPPVVVVVVVVVVAVPVVGEKVAVATAEVVVVVRGPVVKAAIVVAIVVESCDDAIRMGLAPMQGAESM